MGMNLGTKGIILAAGRGSRMGRTYLRQAKKLV